MDPLPDAPEDHCVLRHKLFSRFDTVLFRRSASDGVPVMVIPLGEREASLPLRSLQREFRISDDSPDGRMLGLIAQSLDYVVGLNLGDRLPDEVLTGQASWEVKPVHRSLAAGRLRLQLLAWLDPEAVADGSLSDPNAALRLDQDPKLRARVQAAFEQAAQALELPGPEDVVALMESLGEELSYIEALRDMLLRRVRKLAARLEQMERTAHGDLQRLETLTQASRLTGLALKQISGRFDEIDAQTGEVLAALRNAESQQAFIRTNRDWLYRSHRAWDPILKDWDDAGLALTGAVWMLISRTYRFLAPRYMPAMEWRTFNAPNPGAPAVKDEVAMQW
jgi:hypothetical protein